MSKHAQPRSPGRTPPFISCRKKAIGPPWLP